MLICLVSSLLMGVLNAMRSAAEAGCVLSYLHVICPAWIIELRSAAARSRRALARNMPRLFQLPSRLRRADRKRTLF
jgi:hypothetical protein